MDVFVDTTYLMPFFYLNIDVNGFSREKFREKLLDFRRIHVSEISIVEVKAKIVRMHNRKINEVFRESLSVLRNDEHFVFHGYTADDDTRFEEIGKMNLDFIDRIIVSQAFSVGFLLTEDSQILKNKNLLKKLGLDVVSWKEFLNFNS